MTTEVTRLEPKIKGLQALLDRAQPAIMSALPKTLTAEKFMRVVLTSLRLNPKLSDCTPASFISCVLQAAQLGLTTDGILGHAHLVPFYDRKTDTTICVLIPGYKGLVELALRSNMVSTIEAAVVYRADEWTYERGLNPKLVHSPSEASEPGDMRLAYAIATMKDGTKRSDVIFARDMERIKGFSQTGRKDFGPWKDWPEEMWKKTAIRRLCKLLPLSPEDRRMIEYDEAAEVGKPIDLSQVVELPISAAIAVEEVEGDDAKPKTKLDAAAAALAKKAPQWEDQPEKMADKVAESRAIDGQLDTKIQVLIDSLGEERIVEWMFVKYGISRLEQVPTLSHDGKLELLADLEAGRAQIDTKITQAKKKKTAKSPPAGLFADETATTLVPGED